MYMKCNHTDVAIKNTMHRAQTKHREHFNEINKDLSFYIRFRARVRSTRRIRSHMHYMPFTRIGDQLREHIAALRPFMYVLQHMNANFQVHLLTFALYLRVNAVVSQYAN